MARRAFLFITLICGFISLSLYAEETLPPPADRTVDFIRDIEPIFKANCHQCHGSAKQKGGLRLDLRDAALKGGDTGTAILPGKSADSLLIKNVARIGDATPMPPSGKPLEPDQISILRAWIDQGAVWPETPTASSDPKKHWSFKPPQRPSAPSVADTAWPRNPIDNFILARLETEGIKPSPEADRATLLRRVHLDLTGLPPTPEDLDAFLADTSPDAYEKLVDRLLASPHYGERWARRWLDAARYADTNGYEKDRPRSIWPYRDWVINALNADMPFNQFTIEQIAGDMLPNATQSQKIATGFHRNTMLNEEGGIDVEQFRYEAVVDRVKTTGIVFLGLTVGCAQCHDHKYDPISHKEYFGLFGLLNNADEPELKVPTEEQRQKRENLDRKAEEIESKFEIEFPPYQEDMVWETLQPENYRTASGALLEKSSDSSLRAFFFRPQKDVYQFQASTSFRDIDALRVEVLADDRLPNKGPGRADNGNFVLSEFKVAVSPSGGGELFPLVFASAEADHSQADFDVARAVDGDPKTGWAIGLATGSQNVNRRAIFKLKEPIKNESGLKLALTLEQNYGDRHTIGKFRVSVGRVVRTHYRPELPVDEQRRLHLGEKFSDWERRIAEKSSNWKILDPSKFISEFGATMTKLDDLSILVSGDKPNKDIYHLEFASDLKGITALRLEVLPDPSLPDNGPGRGDVMARGNFMLSEFIARSVGTDSPSTSSTLALQNPTADFTQPGRSAAQTIDDNKETGWAISGGQGKPHAIVYQLKEKLDLSQAQTLAISLVQYFLHQDTIGRFRISATTDDRPATASGVPAEIEEIVMRPPELRDAEQWKRLKRHYLSVAPELAAQQKSLAELKRSLPEFPTTLVMRERDAEHSRVTRLHHRGEFLSPRDEVSPSVPAVLPPLPDGVPANRLALANWLVDDRNPLTARVTVNRIWEAFMGRGLVTTGDDFGFMGAAPSHPELLDWLACEFTRPELSSKPWSMKSMHRLIVTSATYRQSSRVTPELLTRDPDNVLLVRAPRLRLEAEMIRDVALTAGGLLNPKIGGPSVYPLQPPGVTELAYGSPAWPTSSGDDLYRRGLYTFFKRATPYPGFTTFDAPTAEIACTRRLRSNTPLQSLTTLNDPVFVEAAKGLARRIIKANADSSTADRARAAFKICLAREPSTSELEKLTAYVESQRQRIEKGEIDVAKLTGASSSSQDELNANELAVWTAVARVVLNLDEVITRE